VGLVAAWFAGGFAGGVVAYVLGLDPAREAAGLAVSLIGQTAGAWWVVVAVSRGAGSGSLRRDVGLEIRAGNAKGLLWGVGLQVAVALTLSPLVRLLSGDSDTQQAVADLASSTTELWGRLLLIVMFVVVAPFIEEVIFRGAVLSWLARRFSRFWAIGLSAAAFAGVHLADPNAVLAVPSLFVIGFVLGWAALRRGNLSLPIFMHAGVNLLGAIVLMWGDEIIDGLERARDQVESVAHLVGIG
jgi:membrane protease YdiL (CAAX protease family)